MRGAVGERFQCGEAGSARAGGALGSENVGMSNHIYNEKLYPRKSKVSVAMAINHGLGDPKAMARAVAEQGSRLIFRPADIMRWSNGGNKIERLNGLASGALSWDIQANPGVCF